MPRFYDVSTVSEYEQDGKKKTRWTRIGVAFPLKEKDGFTITLEALPVSGRLVLLLHEDRTGGKSQGEKGGI